MAEEGKNPTTKEDNKDQETGVVRITTGGKSPPRLEGRHISTHALARFAKAYEKYDDDMARASEDGVKRAVASMRELVSSEVLGVIAMRFYRGRS